MSDAVFFDTNVIWNFAVIERLDILEASFGESFQWVGAVYDELIGATHHEATLQDAIDLDWPPEPINIPPAEYPAVFAIQRASSSVLSRKLENMGECETIHEMVSRWPEATFLTDDRVASHLARQRGLRTGDTATVMRAAYRAGYLSCPMPYRLMTDMRSLGRGGVVVPRSHEGVCPS